MAVKKTRETKRCCTCKETKPAVAFSRRSGALSHLLRGSCRVCEVQQGLAYQAKHPKAKLEAERRYAASHRKELAAKARAYYATHTNECLATAKAWREKNADRKRANDRAWGEANSERKRAVNKEWRTKNQERRRIVRRAWAARNRAKTNAVTAAWRTANPEKQRACELAWQKKNPQTMLASRHRRRARLRGAPGTLTRREIDEIREAACGLCAYCLRPTPKLTLDHVIPISKGGAHEAANIVMACKPCNSKKNARGPLSMLSKGANRCHL